MNLERTIRRFGRVGIFVLTVCLLFSFRIQRVAAQSVESDSVKYWVFFTDKPTASQAVAKREAARLPQRTLERRRNRATALNPALDLPVAEDYIREVAARGARPVHTSRWLNGISAYVRSGDLESIRSLPFVRSVRPVARGRLDAGSTPSAVPIPLVPVVPVDYGSSFTQLDHANVIPNLEAGIDGSGVLVGVIDTGIGNLEHVAFLTLLAENRLVSSQDFTGQPDDGSRHGHNVLSILAGYREGYLIGPAHGANILHARTEYVNSETTQEEDNFVAGLEWMEMEGVDVVNVSLSYTTFDGGVGDYVYEDMDGETAVTTIAADIAADHGVVVVTSAGNSATKSGLPCSPDQCWYYIGSPADGKSVITVGATNSFDAKAAFSSFGPTADGRIKPDVSAMGVSVTYATTSTCPKPTDTNGFCTTGNGTSYSSPIVAGIVAQMLQVNPDLTPVEVLDIIRSTARAPVTLGSKRRFDPNNAIGWGIVDGAAAVAMAVSIEDGPDVPDAIILSGPFPSPTRGEVSFRLAADAQAGEASLDVFDVLGRRIRSDLAPSFSSESRLRFDLDLPSSGLYLYRLTLENASSTGTLVVL